MTPVLLCSLSFRTAFNAQLYLDRHELQSSQIWLSSHQEIHDQNSSGCPPTPSSILGGIPLLRRGCVFVCGALCAPPPAPGAEVQLPVGGLAIRRADGIISAGIYRCSVHVVLTGYIFHV